MLQIDTILTPIDFSEKSRAAAEQAVALAMHFDANLLFLHVIASASRHPELLGGPDLAVADIAEAKQRLEKLAAEVSLGGDCQALVESGDPAHRIAVNVKERKVDLVVLPTHGHGLFRRAFGGVEVHSDAAPRQASLSLGQRDARKAVPRVFRRLEDDGAIGLRDDGSRFVLGRRQPRVAVHFEATSPFGLPALVEKED